jgi:probable phosphoglycerate mutase
MLNVYLIRHAEAQNNFNRHLIGGQSPQVELTDQGRVQARLLGERLLREGYRFDRLYASTAVRAQETARLVGACMGFGMEEVSLSDRLLELSQGEWTGRVRKDTYTPEVMAALRADTHDFAPPGGESQRMVEARMHAWLEEALAPAPEAGEWSLAAFSHGFAIKALLRRIMDGSPSFTYRIMIHNTGITCLQLLHGQWHLERVNDFAHLAGTPFIGHY